MANTPLAPVPATEDSDAQSLSDLLTIHRKLTDLAVRCGLIDQHGVWVHEFGIPSEVVIHFRGCLAWSRVPKELDSLLRGFKEAAPGYPRYEALYQILGRVGSHAMARMRAAVAKQPQSEARDYVAGLLNEITAAPQKWWPGQLSQLIEDLRSWSSGRRDG